MKRKLLSLLALTLCWASSTWALDQVGGVYQIGTAQDLVDFAALVNGGTTDANAVLTDDIDLNGVTWIPIASEANPYIGTFDGQDFTITNFSYTTTANNTGFFGNLGNGAVVKNFTIEGSITSKHERVGVIGSVGTTANSNVTIRNIHSKVNLTCIKTRQGGIVGAQNGNSTVTIDRCTYSGTLTVTGNVTGNFGGIIGLTNNSASAYVNISNCLFDGVIDDGTGDNAGGIVGYTRSCYCTIKNCLSVGTIIATNPGQFIGQINTTSHQTYEGVNYYLTGDKTQGTGSATEAGTLPVKVTATQLASGEIAYALNGDQSTINWFQTLNDDNYPTPYGADIVYQNGRKYCDGSLYPDVSYSNTNLGMTTDDHNFVDGICSNCGAPDPIYMTANGDGYFEIGTPAQLKWFAAWVNSSSDNTSSNAVLTADIDMTSIAATWVPIGDWSTGAVTSAYKGRFNGQGHEISNFNATTNQTYYGIFGVVSAATIENFSIRGTITNNDYSNIGAIGYSRDTSTNIQNIQSYLTITNNGNDKNVGGVLGSGNSGTTNIDRCAFFGTINAIDKTNVGGIVGYFANGSGSIVNISNCLFDGTITSEISNSYCGGIAGYGGANVSGVKIENCLSLGTITAPVNGQFFGNIRNVGSSITSCYYQGNNINGTGSSALTTIDATAVTAEQLASGEVCYTLNGDQSNIVWYQAIGTDANPVLDNTHGIVYVNGTVCPDTGAPQGTASYSNAEGTVVGSHVYTGGDGFCIYCGTVDASYMSPVDGYYLIGTPTELVWFAAFVNAGTYNANAKLTADIDLTGVTWTPIGLGTGNSAPGATAYAGIFDGQGYSITGFVAEGNGHLGLFGDANGATIKNFTLSGSLTVTGGYFGGVVACPINSTIENVHSVLAISVPNSGTHHVGGVVGSARGNNTIDRCSFSGSMTVAAGSTDNFAGIVAYITGGDKVTNCVNYGDITFADTGCAAGGIVGYLNSTSAYVQNCLTIGTILFAGEGTPKYGAAILGRTKGYATEKVTNNYWLEGSAYGAAKKDDGTDPLATGSVTAEQLASGEVAYNLGSAWYQALGTDDYPVLDSTKPGVYKLTVGSAGWASFVPEVNIASLPDNVIVYVGQNNGSSLHLEQVTEVPANNAFVVKADEGDYYYNDTDAAITLTESNDLTYSDDVVVANGTQYCLANKASGVGFYKVGTGINIPARKAYLEVSSPVKGFYGFDLDDDPTAIEMVNGQSSMVNEIYNLAGQRMSKAQKGINIMNGKKIAIK